MLTFTISTSSFPSNAPPLLLYNETNGFGSRPMKQIKSNQATFIRRKNIFESRRLVHLLAGSLVLFALAGLRAAPAEKLQFNRDIRPILSDRCFKCHGPDPASRKAGLRLDRAEDAYAERKKSHGHPIVPGQPEQSLLCRRVFSTNQDEMMPPPESNLALSSAERDTLRRWIAEGAEYQPHWAFIPLPDSVPLPAVKKNSWPRNEIDRFILARLEKENISPSAEADKTRWLRRVTYDLTGLPPAPAETDAFLADNSPAAYEKVVHRLLASRHSGE